MTRKALHTDPSKKSPWLNAKKRPEKVFKPLYSLVCGQVTCAYCGTINKVEKNAEIVRDYPNDRFYATINCVNPECDALITGWIYIGD